MALGNPIAPGLTVAVRLRPAEQFLFNVVVRSEAISTLLPSPSPPSKSLRRTIAGPATPLFAHYPPQKAHPIPSCACSPITMKASMFLLGASAILASASPLRNALEKREIEKREMKTEWVYEVVTVTVVAGDEPETTAPAATKPTGVVFMEAPAPKYTAPSTTKEAAKPKKVKKPVSKPSTTKEAPKVTIVTVEPQPESTKETVYESPAPVVEKPKTTVEKVVAKPTKVAEPKVEVPASGGDDLSLDGAYNTVMLAYHNIHRLNHSASALEWDDELAGYAENTANGCVFEHDMNQGNGGYGQNLASWGATSDIDGLKNKAAAGGITNQWYNNEMANWAFYGQENPPADMNIDLYGHFTQVVWKDSTKVGCATVKCPAGTVLSFPSWYTVCNYNPQGNFGGRYGDNVLKPKGEKRVTV
ncbi:putative pathogenesis-related protein [Fusarium oxysporum f. sp. rapae]|uniref:Putative pathogenesis-related protein n=1 Tax=Fusarium oxysporum f. sp. rapae TaxID=485398 RepID=A0A8J5PD18_FUSOX|nr:putative pathogenesis-related protein [Fusarium oxysporum f. sp. rapae]